MKDDDRTPGMLEVSVSEDMTEKASLDAAVATVTKAANAYSVGIMITQIGANRFVVRAHPEVPNGLVRRRTWVQHQAAPLT